MALPLTIQNHLSKFFRLLRNWQVPAVCISNSARTISKRWLLNHAELLLDFDLCLIDRVMNETIIQLFAIFTVTRNREPLNNWSYVQQAIAFAGRW
jgi:hypothetical protein